MYIYIYILESACALKRALDSRLRGRIAYSQQLAPTASPSVRDESPITHSINVLHRCHDVCSCSANHFGDACDDTILQVRNVC